MNSRDEERDRLRRELKYAQEELNRLRRIQKAAAPLLDKDLVSGRPSSIVSEASTVSGESGDEIKEGEQIEEHEPGTGIVVSPTSTLVTSAWRHQSVHSSKSILLVNFITLNYYHLKVSEFILKVINP